MNLSHAGSAAKTAYGFISLPPAIHRIAGISVPL
jgi:hypothetical protein